MVCWKKSFEENRSRENVILSLGFIKERNNEKCEEFRRKFREKEINARAIYLWIQIYEKLT